MENGKKTNIVICDPKVPMWLVLRQQWKMVPPKFFGIYFFEEPPQETFVKASESGYVDYLLGRIIKTDYGEWPRLDPRLYDRDIGKGALKQCYELALLEFESQMNQD